MVLGEIRQAFVNGSRPQKAVIIGAALLIVGSTVNAISGPPTSPVAVVGSPTRDAVVGPSSVIAATGLDAPTPEPSATDGSSPEPTATPEPSPTPEPTPAPTPARAATPKPVTFALAFTSLTSPVSPNQYATASVKTVPGASCTIVVEYKSGPSSAAGLGPRTADSSGVASWTWKVGGRTTPGSWPVTVTCSEGAGSASVVEYLQVL